MEWNLPVKKAAFSICAVAAFWIWALYITDYGDGVFAGNYACHVDGQTLSLRLNPDHTFHQVRIRNGIADQSDGTWRRMGEAGAFFSSTLAVPQQRIMRNGTAYATLYKTWGILPYISLDSIATAPIYRKSLL